MPENGTDLRIAGVERGPRVTFLFDGQTVSATVDESIAAALLAAGFRGTRRTMKREGLRGYFCGMGICWECVVAIEGRGHVRSCLVPVEPGLNVSSLNPKEPLR